MTYPDTNLTHKIRLSIMGLLIALFFIISPLVIMYTAGYRWDSENGGIKETGVLSVDIKPENAGVFLNDVQINKKLPLYLPNRAPGSYKIKLALPGYKTWEKDIEIASKKTTYIKDITLFKDSLPARITEVAEIGIQSLYSSNSGKYLLLVSKNNNIYEMDIFDTENQNLEAVSRLKSDTEPITNWSPFADFLILQTQSGTQTNLQIINAKDNNSASYTFYYPIQNIIWSKNTSLLIYLEDRNIIYTLDLNAKNNFTETANNPWLVDDKQNLWSVDLQNNLILTSNNKTENLGKLPEKIREIIDANESRVILKTNQNVLIVKLDNQKITNVQSINTQEIFYNQNTKEWMTWSPWELWTIYDNGKTSLLNRTSNRINQVIPLDQYGVVLLSSENKIIGFNPGYYTEHELLRNGIIQTVGVNINLRKIFFLGEVAGKHGLYELEY